MVGLDIGKSSHNKQKKLRSNVWENFKKLKDEDGKDVAICNRCEKKFNGSSKKGTTHLRNHFISCQKKRNEGGASGSGDKPVGNSATDQQLNHLDRAKMLIKQCYWDLPNPIRDTDIINIYNEEKEKLRIYFEELCCRFSLMIRNMADGKCTCFMVSFIDDDWKLKEKIIGFKCIEGDQNMKVLKNVLLDLGIDNKISSMVTDGDSDIYVLSSDKRENRFSCQGSLLSNCKLCVRDFYDIDITCPGFFGEMEKVLHDHMSKISNYITKTSSKIGTFQIAKDRARSLGKEVTAEDIPTEEKLEHMFSMELFKIALDLKEAFFELENMDPDFKSINLTKEQWDVITTFYQFCYENDFGHIFWHLLYCKTANMFFPVLCRLYKKSLVLLTLNSFICGKIYLQFVRDAEKCWDEYNLILAMAAVLDPRFKMDIVKQWYKKIYGDKCETQLEIFTNYLTGVYNEYAKGTNNFQSSISYRMLDILGNSSHDLDSGQSLNFELHLYLKDVNFPLIEDFDILEWWRVYSRYFPTLAKMARDFLSIKITVPSEYMFFEFPFSHKDFDSDIVKEAFACTKSWLTN
ncbi:hypothetical protein EZV62_008876 [Acer yangbiense]|uniref:BED-type domain-containing protein n=1 Tax=Acer yangbiense TaxID=1000413 RepID=A0A5C7IER3_9ROSI|nr:hypothetical protein EZV62_008876 [Acer yangbiense]